MINNKASPGPTVNLKPSKHSKTAFYICGLFSKILEWTKLYKCIITSSYPDPSNPKVKPFTH